jgi:hypothetical protein
MKSHERFILYGTLGLALGTWVGFLMHVISRH